LRLLIESGDVAAALLEGRVACVQDRLKPTGRGEHLRRGGLGPDPVDQRADLISFARVTRRTQDNQVVHLHAAPRNDPHQGLATLDVEHEASPGRGPLRVGPEEPYTSARLDSLEGGDIDDDAF
jgi:hypothetical protein